MHSSAFQEIVLDYLLDEIVKNYIVFNKPSLKKVLKQLQYQHNRHHHHHHQQQYVHQQPQQQQKEKLLFKQRRRRVQNWLYQFLIQLILTTTPLTTIRHHSRAKIQTHSLQKYYNQNTNCIRSILCA